jgi:hypothetical protein
MNSFSKTFAEARTKFIAAAREAGARIYTYGREDLSGKDGEPLKCDVAVLGDATSQKAAIAIAGTHGAEGYCGSAILNRWLSSRTREPPVDGIKIVLVHAINPWAFSYMTRTTENNVDLNRNFLVNRKSFERNNESYDKLVPFLHAKSIEADLSLAAYKAYRAYLDQHGWQIENESWQGQTHHSDGIYFAGKEPEWANQVFRKIINDHLGSATTIGFIDWHTGLGGYGEVVHLIFDELGSPEHKAASTWWANTENGGSVFNAGVMPKYEGLLCRAIRQELQQPKIAGAVIEFGVADDYSMFRSDRLDRWLRFEGRNDPQHDELREEYRNSCCPSDVGWRRLVMREGPLKMEQLAKGVLNWHE